MQKPPPPRKRQPLCPDCMSAPKAPGDGYCRPCRYARTRRTRERFLKRREFEVLSGDVKRCHFCHELVPVELMLNDRAECKVCRSVRSKELAAGAERFKPWRRKGLRKAGI